MIRLLLKLPLFLSVAIHADPATKDGSKTVVQLLERSFDFIQNLIGGLIAIVVVSSFAIEYMARRLPERGA